MPLLKGKTRNPNIGGFVLLGFGVVLLIEAISNQSGMSGILGLMLGAAGGIPLYRRHKAVEAAERAAQRQRETEAAESAARAAQAAEEKRREAEADAEFEAEQAKMREANAYQRLHMQVNELLNYATRLKAEGENRQLLVTMMEAVGQIAGQRDLDRRLLAEESIASDIRLFFAQMDRLGLQQEMVYQRAKRVLDAPSDRSAVA